MFAQGVKWFFLCNADGKTDFYLTADGEDVQLSPMDKEEVLELLNENGINFGKSPASCTHTLQPCDRSDLFKAAKKNIKNPDLQKYVKENKRDLMETLEEIISLHHSGMSADKLELFSYGLPLICMGINKSLSSKIIKDGFNRAGMYLVNATNCFRNCDSRILEVAKTG